MLTDCAAIASAVIDTMEEHCAPVPSNQLSEK